MAVSALGGVGQDQFIQLLVAQLQNQDPLEPASADSFITQLSSLSQVEGLQSLNASFAQMLQLQQLSQGIDLIGKQVEYTPTDGSADVTGKVNSLSVQNGQFVLDVDGTSVTLDQLVSVNAS